MSWALSAADSGARSWAERGVQLLVDAAAEVVLGQPLVVEDRAELVDQVVVDLLAQLVEHRVAPLVPGGRRRLHFVQALVERHCDSSLS